MDPSLLFMSVRDFQYDVAISEIQEYEEELLIRDLTPFDYSYFSSVAGQILSEMYEQKIRWELNSKMIWIPSPTDIVASFYYSYSGYAEKAKNDDHRKIFSLAKQAAGEILDRFL